MTTAVNSGAAKGGNYWSQRVGGRDGGVAAAWAERALVILCELAPSTLRAGTVAARAALNVRLECGVLEVTAVCCDPDARLTEVQLVPAPAGGVAELYAVALKRALLVVVRRFLFVRWRVPGGKV